MGAAALAINGVGEVVQRLRVVGGDRFLLKVKVRDDRSERGVEVNSVNYGDVASSGRSM